MEEDKESKDREAYDVKHDLIAAQIEMEKMEHEMEQLQKAKSELSRQAEKLHIRKLEDLTEIKDEWGGCQPAVLLVILEAEKSGRIMNGNWRLIWPPAGSFEV